MKRSIFFALPLVVAASLPLGGVAFAQSDPGRADALYKEAVDLFKAGNVRGACAKLDESFNLDPKTQTLFSLAKCRQREGRVATSAAQFKELVKRGEREGDAAKLADYKTKLGEVEPLVPHAVLELEGHPEVTAVLVDGKSLPRDQWAAPIALDPGDHTFIFSATGKADTEKAVSLKESETVTIALGPPAPTSEAAGSGTGASAGVGSSKEGGSSPTLGYILGGVGIAAIGVGTVTGIIAINHKSTADERFDNRDPSFKDSDDAASTTALVSTISFGIGIVGLAAGAYLVLTHDSKKTAATTRRFDFGMTSDRVMFGGRF